MRTLQARVWILGVLALVACGGGSAAPSEVVAFSDDFANALPPEQGLGPNWSVVGRWHVIGGAAATELDSTHLATAIGFDCGDCRVEAKVIGPGSGETGLFVRATPGGDRYDAVLLPGGDIAIRRWRYGGPTIVGQAASGISDATDWTTLSLSAHGTSPVQLVAQVNGTAKVSLSDSDPLRLDGAGQLGLTASASGAMFSAFRLYQPASDAGASSAPDAGTPSHDAGVTLPDSGTPTPDAGGNVVPDAGTPTPDAGTPTPDAGTPTPDAGTPTPDAGTPDAGMPAPDAGTPTPDAGSGVPDGGPVDGGTGGGADAGPALLFGDDFLLETKTSGGLGSSWTVTGRWFESGGQAQVDLDGTNQALETVATCGDCRVDAQVLGFGTQEIGVSLRVLSAADRYDAVLLANGNVRIRRVRSGTSTTLAEGPSGLPALNQWSTLSLQAAGSGPVDLAAMVNGRVILSITDSGPGAITAVGRAGLWATSAGVGFDTFRLTATGNTVPPVPSANDDWPFYRRDVLGTAIAPDTLTEAQARNLSLAFKVSFPGSGSDANPIVAGGKLYVVLFDGWVIALDASNGTNLWRAWIGVGVKSACVSYSLGPVGAAAVVGQQLLVPGGDGTVYSFDKDTGTPIWHTSVASTAADEFLYSSIFPLNGKLYVGVSTLSEVVCGAIPGKLVALDAQTGAVTGTWWADPNHGGGGGVWTQPVYDAASGKLFITTGTVADGVDPTTEPLQQAFVAIDPNTMATLDSFQPVPNVFADEFDFGASPTLFDTPSGRHLIAAANKNGDVYALDRDHLANGVVWTSQICGPGDSPDQGNSSIVSAVFDHGSLFVAGEQTTDGYPGAIAALDPETGDKKWLVHPNGFVLPALSAVGDVLIAGVTHSGAYTGELNVLSQADGTLLYSYQTAGRLFGEPTWANGMLYVADDAGNVYALRP